MTVPLYRTGDMEQALRVLSQRNHHVVALAEYRVKKIIKLRGRSPKLEGVPMLYVMGWKPEADKIIGRWQQDGGVLIYRPVPRKASLHPASDALLLVEAPLQYDWLEQRIANVRQGAVIYRPPAWDLHEDAMDHVWPRRHQYETMDAVLASLVGRALPDQLQRVSELVPQWTKFAIFTDTEMAAITGWDTRMIRAIFRWKYQRNYFRFSLFALRYAARHHEIKWAYEVLEAQPSVGKKLHVLRGETPFEGERPAFKAALRNMVRLNYITREGTVFMVNMQRTPLDLDRIDAVHNMHRGRWLKVRNLVDSLPEYPL